MSTSGEIRVAGPADAGSIAALRRAWTEETAGGPIDDVGFEGRFDAWLERERDQRVTWLGDVDGRSVAMLNLLVFTRMPVPRPLPGSSDGPAPGPAGADHPTQWGYLANFFVRPEHRGAGLGARMLAACTSYADEHGFARVVLSPSERSVPLYARAGFESATSLLVRTPRRRS